MNVSVTPPTGGGNFTSVATLSGSILETFQVDYIITAPIAIASPLSTKFVDVEAVSYGPPFKFPPQIPPQSELERIANYLTGVTRIYAMSATGKIFYAEINNIQNMQISRDCAPGSTVKMREIFNTFDLGIKQGEGNWSMSVDHNHLYLYNSVTGMVHRLNIQSNNGSLSLDASFSGQSNDPTATDSYFARVTNVLLNNNSGVTNFFGLNGTGSNDAFVYKFNGTNYTASGLALPNLDENPIPLDLAGAATEAFSN